VGALVTVLDNPPYGPNVEEAKVNDRSTNLRDEISLTNVFLLEFNAADSRHRP
jgi:hypothetical protein